MIAVRWNPVPGALPVPSQAAWATPPNETRDDAHARPERPSARPLLPLSGYSRPQESDGVAWRERQIVQSQLNLVERRRLSLRETPNVLRAALGAMPESGTNRSRMYGR